MTPFRATGTRIVVLGTGTGVGKTHVSAALVGAAARARLRVAGLKPVETGVGVDAEGTDAAVLSRAAGVFHVKHSLYGLPDPVSPHLAARRAHVRIDLGTLRRWVDAAAERGVKHVVYISCAAVSHGEEVPGLVARRAAEHREVHAGTEVTPGGRKDDRTCASSIADLADDVGQLARRHLEALGPRGGREHLTRFRCERVEEQLHGGRRIVDDEHLHAFNHV